VGHAVRLVLVPCMSERGKTVFYTVSTFTLVFVYLSYLFGWPF